MKKQTLAISLIVASLTGCAYVTNYTASDLYLKGQLQAEQGNLPQAFAILTKAIQTNPKMGLAYEARGNVLRDQGNYEQAAADFEKATKLEPYNFNANFQLGLMYQYLKRFADAVVAYQKAVEIRPLDPDANMNLALAYTQLGQPFNGLNYAQRAVQGNPESSTAQANLGILYTQCGYDTAAIDALKRSIELNSRQPEVYVNLGQLYINAGTKDQRDGHPDDAPAKFGQAKNVLETAQTLAPSPLVSDRLGVAYYKLQQWDKATASFNDALHMDPKYYSALNGLGVVAMSQALVSTPPDVTKARVAVDCWNKSLAIKSDQETIRKLVNQYTPPQ